MQKLEVSSFSGPLPPPEQLEHYERIAPGLHDRIVKMAEAQVSMAQDQAQHRFRLERTVIDASVRQAWLGQVFAFIIGMTGLLGATHVIHEGREIGGAAAFVSSLAALVTVFFVGRKAQIRELESKREYGEAVKKAIGS